MRSNPRARKSILGAAMTLGRWMRVSYSSTILPTMSCNSAAFNPIFSAAFSKSSLLTALPREVATAGAFLSNGQVVAQNWLRH
jgi:hypothetical protein